MLEAVGSIESCQEGEARARAQAKQKFDEMVDSPCIADDDDFASLKRLVDNDDGWNLELCKANTLVWTRSIPGCNFQMVKINSRFEDIEPECVFDVLLDPDYRKEWDSHMLESFDIGNFNVNNDVGYYASKYIPFH